LALPNTVVSDRVLNTDNRASNCNAHRLQPATTVGTSPN
jgi:hypothetical protein